MLHWFREGPDAFRAFFFDRVGKERSDGGQGLGIHAFIDFAFLLCENPRKRPLLRG